MADNYNNDGLEAFFRRRMENYEETPRPEMWDKIGANIPPKPVAAWWKRPGWWLGIFLSAVILLSLWQFQRIHQFKQIINKQKADIENLQKEKITPRQTPENKDVLETSLPVQGDSSDPNATDGGKVDQSRIIAQVKKEQPQNSPKENLVLNQNNKNTAKDTPPVTDNGKIENSKDKNPGVLENEISAPERVIATPKPAVNYLVTRQPSVIKTIQSDIPAKAKVAPISNAGFYFSLSGGSLTTAYNGPLNRSYSEALNSSRNDFNPFNTARDEFTFLAGIQFNKKWSIETGVGYRANRVSIFHSQSFHYSEDVTFGYDQDGNPIGNYSSTGDQAPAFRYEILNTIQQDGMDIEEGDEFFIDASFKYNSRYFSIPFWVKYRIGKKRLHGYAKTGFAWNFLADSNKNLRASSLSADRLSLERVDFKYDALNDAFMELGVAMGLGFDFNQHYSIGLEALYYHSVASVLKTKQDALGVSMALKYQF